MRWLVRVWEGFGVKAEARIDEMGKGGPETETKGLNINRFASDYKQRGPRVEICFILILASLRYRYNTATDIYRINKVAQSRLQSHTGPM